MKVKQINTPLDKAITVVVLMSGKLDNYYRLKTLKLLEKKPYYITELQKALGIKVYKSIHDSLRVLFIIKLINLEKIHNTSGRQVRVTLNKEIYDLPMVQIILAELWKKHKLN